MTKDMCTVIYTDDNSNNFSMRADKATIEAIGNGAKLGAVVVTTAIPAMPKGLRPRYVYARGDTTDALRKIVCYTKTATAFTTPGTTLTMSPYRGSGVATETFTVVGQNYGEKRHRNIVDSPTIA